MKRIFFFLIIWSLIPLFSVAGSNIPDSLTITWMKGKQYLVHKVEKGDTWDKISVYYGIPINTLRQENKEIDELNVNQFVFVPYQKNVESRKIKVRSIAAGKRVVQQAGGEKIFHTVKSGENLYRISIQYNLSVDKLKSMNNIQSNQLRVGQRLHVGYSEKAEEQKTIRATPETETAAQKVEEVQEPAKIKKESGKELSPSDSVYNQMIEDIDFKNASNPFTEVEPTKEIENIKKVTGGKKVKQIRETGVATFILDEELDQRKFYALHRTAPIGTIVKVLNIMTNQSVFVKVVGRLPDTGDNNNLIIKLSESAAREILARDPFFRVELSYGEIK